MHYTKFTNKTLKHNIFRVLLQFLLRKIGPWNVILASFFMLKTGFLILSAFWSSLDHSDRDIRILCLFFDPG